MIEEHKALKDDKLITPKFIQEYGTPLDFFLVIVENIKYI